MKPTIKAFSLFVLVILIGLGCARKTVTRVDTNTDIDLSGRWNDADSRRVAEALSESVIESAWLENFTRYHDRKPVVIVGLMTNKSHEHIEAETFIKDIEKEMIRTGTVRVVQNSVFREKLREERADQQEMASPETAKRWGAELGADFMMFGTINSIVDSEGKRQVTFYQVDLELANLETNEIVWLDGKKIKKYIVN
ncbi:penicillin-binding protein activator LpoB [Catalinimonas niigatensis]|uniref:penicillin-binding protein activator LpoB n=1 Tax=Catalinimonas niigatensis TaxID=1397264 RepID=UPI002665604C|nr:penicillin-binding protein activator LpoB [Catalinimonas niigatensis]WPP49565.1 penicillin-binding protein activator LpoB [Catalinimonas niigatensis]